MAPTASVLHSRGLGFGQVPVYDARRVLAGTAIVEILASSIKVAPAGESICWMSPWTKSPWDAYILATGFEQHSITPLISSNALELHNK